MKRLVKVAFFLIYSSLELLKSTIVNIFHCAVVDIWHHYQCKPQDHAELGLQTISLCLLSLCSNEHFQKQRGSKHREAVCIRDI